MERFAEIYSLSDKTRDKPITFDQLKQYLKAKLDPKPARQLSTTIRNDEFVEKLLGFDSKTRMMQGLYNWTVERKVEKLLQQSAKIKSLVDRDKNGEALDKNSLEKLNQFYQKMINLENSFDKNQINGGIFPADPIGYRVIPNEEFKNLREDIAFILQRAGRIH